MLALILAGFMIMAAVDTAPPETLDRSHLTLSFEETFPGDHLDRWSLGGPHGRWKTNTNYRDQTGPDAYKSHTLIWNLNKQLWVDPEFTGQGDKPLGLDPFAVADGVLTIKGWPTPAGLDSKLWGYPYLTGMISTETSFAQTYGYFEITAEWPRGKGAHPTFWLLPTDKSWPPEFDVAEEIGNPDEAYFTLHFTGADGKAAQDAYQLKPAGSGDRFTRFGMLWTPTIIAWYQDDRLIRRIRNPGIDKPCYMLATLEIGGKWPGDPDGTTPWPMAWRIKAIRAYALKDVPVSPGSPAPPRSPA